MATQRDLNGTEPERLHSVRRSLAVLEALASRSGGATPKELGLALGLHLSTCYRLLNTLVSAGYVARDAEGLFRLGSRVAYLNQGYLAALHAPPEALPFVQALQLTTGETTVLAQLEGDDVVNVAVVLGSRPGAIPHGYPGMAAPAQAYASGRVLLAWLPAPRLEAYLERSALVPDPPFPALHRDALRAELENIRQVGYAVDDSGHHGVGCIAAPVIEPDGAAAASLTIVAPCGRFRQEEQSLARVILAVTRAIGTLHADAPACGAGSEAAIEDSEAAAKAAIAAAVTEIGEAMSRVG